MRLTQEIAQEIPRLGGERIREGSRSRAVSKFQAVAKSPRENGIAVRALDRCISIIFKEEFASAKNEEARDALSKRWRDFCSRYSRKSGEEGLTFGQAVARSVGCEHSGVPMGSREHQRLAIEGGKRADWSQSRE